MSNFVPKKEYLRRILLHNFIFKESAAEAHRRLATYGDHTLPETTCREGFRRLKNNDFVVEDKKCSGVPKTFEDKESDALDSCRAIAKLEESLGVGDTTVPKRLKVLGMILNQVHRVSYDFKQRNVERRLFRCEQFLQRQRGKGFYIVP